VRAVHKGSRRQRNRWMLAGFGSAIAAGLAIWAITAMLMTTPQLPDAGPAIPGVTIAMEQEHTVRLVFASAEALDSATLTVSLPEGVVFVNSRIELAHRECSLSHINRTTSTECPLSALSRLK